MTSSGWFLMARAFWPVLAAFGHFCALLSWVPCVRRAREDQEADRALLKTEQNRSEIGMNIDLNRTKGNQREPRTNYFSLRDGRLERGEVRPSMVEPRGQ